MSTDITRAEVPPQPRPFPPLPGQPPQPQPPNAPALPPVHVNPPMVYVEPAFEYRHLARRIGADQMPGDDELDSLGADGWELVGVINDGRSAHFYFKRQTK